LLGWPLRELLCLCHTRGMSETRYTLQIPPELAGGRLDKALATLLADQPQAISRARLQALMAQGQLSPAHSPKQPAQAGAVYELTVPAATPSAMPAQDLPLEIVFEDEHLMVINKPAGLVVHPAAGNWDGTLVNALLWHRGAELSGIGGVQRPGIVHRLDKETSGLMVVAKSDTAHHGLSAQFAGHKLARTYAALVWGLPQPQSGTISQPIGRSSHNRQKMAVVARGKPAITHYALRERLCAGAFTLLTCTLETGRTHQIRVHLSHAGHPLVGDPLYGSAGGRKAARLPAAAAQAVAVFTRQALHACELRFAHPILGHQMRFSVDLPQDFADLLKALRDSPLR
jgi:23S rRNA pseudouridine1911/1915/1917 synthase